MSENRKKLPRVTSPKGRFKWPRLTEPDTKFKEAGEYTVKLLLDADDTATMLDKLQPLFDASVKEGKKAWSALKPAIQRKYPFKTVDFYGPEYDEDGEETGLTEFNIKMTASGVTRATGKPWERKPALFDAKGRPITGTISIWGGTIGKVSFEVMPFFVAAVGAGFSLRLQAVQIIDLVSGGQREASEYGFEEEEGGYAAEDDAASDDEDGDEDGAEATDDGEGDF